MLGQPVSFNCRGRVRVCGFTTILAILALSRHPEILRRSHARSPVPLPTTQGATLCRVVPRSAVDGTSVKPSHPNPPSTQPTGNLGNPDRQPKQPPSRPGSTCAGGEGRYILYITNSEHSAIEGPITAIPLTFPPSQPRRPFPTITIAKHQPGPKPVSPRGE